MPRYEFKTPGPDAGRKKGVTNKITRDLKAMILGALEANGGQNYLEKQALENPVAFLTLLGKVLPTTLQGDPDRPLTVTRIEHVIVEPKPLIEGRILQEDETIQ
jgi:hypothetical protein